MIITRRNFFGLLAAPAIIHTAGLIMPIKPFATTPVERSVLLPPGTYQVTALDMEAVDRGGRSVFMMTYKLLGTDQTITKEYRL